MYIHDPLNEEFNAIEGVFRQPQSMAVIAGAGTGKTYALVENYLLALFGYDATGDKKRPDEIVALTFTEKAAHEMKLRVIKRLSSLLIDNKASYDDTFSSACVNNPPKAIEIKKILRAIPNAPISTFHGFCSSILRKEAHYFNLRHDFGIMNPHEEMAHARNILIPLVMRHIEANDSRVRDLLARFHLQGNILSQGLIDNLLGLYFKLLEHGITLAEPLSLNYRQISKVDLSSIKDALHEFLLASRTNEAKAKISDALQFYLEHEQSFLSEDEYSVAKTYDYLRQSLTGNFGDKNARQAVIKAVVNLGAYLVDKFTCSDELAVMSLLTEFDQAFNRFKFNESMLGYGDLLSKAKTLLLENHAIRNQIKQKIKHLLVDEYQDTSPIQEDIISLLIENKNKTEHLPNIGRILDHVDINNASSLFIVGDKKQSIYGFRGADITLFDHMTNKMAEGNQSFIKRYQTTNYRSSKKVIELVNLVCSHTLKEQGYEDKHALTAAHTERAGLCGLWIKEGDEFDKTKANLTAAAFGTLDLLKNRSDLSPKDIVVLVRRIKSAFAIKQDLERYGVPTRIIAGDGFYQRQEVVDIISALKLILDPGSGMASMVVLRSPIVLLSDQEILAIKIHAGEINLCSAMTAKNEGLFSSSSSARLESFFNLLHGLREKIFSKGLRWALDQIITQHKLAHALGLSDDAVQQYANIKKLCARVILNKKNPIIAIEEMYQRIVTDFREPLAENSSSQNEVTIMTIHQSKGLEFKVVVLADGESRLLSQAPDFLADKNLGLAVRAKNRPIALANSFDKNDALAKSRFDILKSNLIKKEQEEMARLLYVALTRAQDEVYVSSSKAAFNALASKSSMVGLFLLAYNHNKEQFLSLCDVQYIVAPKEPLMVENSPDIISKKKLFKLETKRTRIFASEILAHETKTIKLDSKYKKVRIDGDLAHKLLAQAFSNILPAKNPSIIDDVLDALIRSLGIEIDDVVRASIDAVRITIEILLRSLDNGGNIIQEMPLSCWPTPNILVEGFADMVYLGDFIGVLEFKSSLSALTSPKSKMQVLAYAEALRRQFDKPIKFSLHLIGSKQTIEWHDYDEDVQAMFLKVIESQ